MNFQTSTIQFHGRKDSFVPAQIGLFTNENGVNDFIYPVYTTTEVSALLQEQAVVAINISGGKDSICVAIRLNDYLNEIGHTGPRVLIHSDLGRVEWKDSIKQCQIVAQRLGWELIIVKRAAGDMMDRWETRWKNNVARYANLECVKLILPWSTPSMRFCTSELKTTLICAELTRRYPKHKILSITGVRRAESSARAKMPVASQNVKLSARGCYGLNWNPIITWSTPEVFSYLQDRNHPLHEAYTIYGSSRVSCAFCIMGSMGDLVASATCEDNQDIYRQMVELEIQSTYAFQGNHWLADVAPYLLNSETRILLDKAKLAGKVRMQAEAAIPKHLLYSNGWPTSIPTLEEAELIAMVRREVSAAVGIEINYVDAESILNRYKELMIKSQEVN